jgi:hypothetical protein
MMRIISKNRTGYICGVICLVFSHLSFGQCEVELINPSNLNFSGGGGYSDVVIETYPYNCTPSFSSVPEWITIAKINAETYRFTCAANTGDERTDIIIVGVHDNITIWQDYAPLSGGIIGGPSMVCYNSSAGTLTNTVSPTGGDCDGNYTYQW